MKRALLIITTLIGFTSCQQPESNTIDTNFIHVVYFWLNNPDSQTDKQEFEEKLGLFMETSNYAKTKFVGVPSLSDRDVVDDSFSYSLIVSFTSKEEQDLYQTEPAHLKFVEDAKHLWSKVIVYDSLDSKK